MASLGRNRKASDKIFDFYCSPCKNKCKNIKAVKYCTDCQEYLCGNCIENHKSFSALAGHKLVGKTQFGRLTSGTNSQDFVSEPTERCEIHTTKLVDMYCAEHDAVGCHICIAINHKPCQETFYIPDYVKTTPQTDLNRKVYEELHKIMSKLESLMKETKKAKDNNNNAKALCLDEVKSFRAELNQILDRLEQDAIAEIEKQYNMLDAMYQAEIKKTQDVLDNLTTSKVAMELSSKNASQKFVTTKMCANVISENEMHTVGPGVLSENSLTFTKNLKLLSFLQNLNSLGQLLQTKKYTLYKIVGKESFNLKLPDDTFDCEIWSSCILDSSDLLLADFRNMNIKLVDGKTFKVKSSMVMPSDPLSLCKVKGKEAVVSLANQTLQFVSVNGQILLTRSLKFDHSCRGIAVMDSQLVVSEDGPRVYIYTMDGTRLKTIDKDVKGNVVFGHVKDICVSDDGRKIHVLDSDEGMITVDIYGKVIWKYSGSGLKDACGVCADGSGNLFVCDCHSHTIVQIGTDGQYIGEVVSASYCQEYPQAVCFDRKNAKLHVFFGNELHVFEVQLTI